jgi:hypothetical protein
MSTTSQRKPTGPALRSYPVLAAVLIGLTLLASAGCDGNKSRSDNTPSDSRPFPYAPQPPSENWGFKDVLDLIQLFILRWGALIFGGAAVIACCILMNISDKAASTASNVGYVHNELGRLRDDLREMKKELAAAAEKLAAKMK